MSRFTDGKGTEWKLVLDAGLMQQVKSETEVDLSIVSKDSSWITALFADVGKLVSILHIVCEDQIKELGLSPRDFARRFTGEVLDAAGFALAGAIADFFPRSRIAQALRENLPKLWKKAEDQMIKKIEKMVNDPFPDLPSPTNSPASSESPPPG